MRKYLLSIMSLLMISFNVCYSAADNIDPLFEDVDRILYPVDISGKIVDQDGNLFTADATLIITAEIAERWDYKEGAGPPDLIARNEVFEQKITGGRFSWKGKVTNLFVEIKKEGFSNDVVHLKPDFQTQQIKANDILLHLIPKGMPSKLEFTRGAEINEKDNKPYGWSFTRRWYFPAGEEESAWMTLSFNEKEEAVYAMKEPGGFVFFPGYPSFESKPDELGANLDWMTQAPESGYVQTIIPEEDKIKNKTLFSPCYYFRTPNGKYGKICFIRGRFDYYLQPDGSRNLEAGDIVEVGPLRPEYRERLEKEQRGW